MLCRASLVVGAALCGLCDVTLASPSKFLIEHSFDGEKFEKRGEVTLRSAGGTQASISQPFVQGHADTLYEQAVNGRDYYVRIRRADDPEETAVQSFISACSFYQSAMSDTMHLYLDQNDRPQSVHLSSTGKCKATIKKKKITKIKTSFVIRRGDAGPMPFVDDYIEALKKQQEGGGEEQKGFFQRYWMYIVPVYIFLMLNSRGGDGGGGGGGS